jgi:uncharacterized protein
LTPANRSPPQRILGIAGTESGFDHAGPINAHLPAAFGKDHLNRLERGEIMACESGITCDGCGACCLSVGHPPFLLELDDGIPRPIAGADSEADLRRLHSAPPAAQAAYLAHYGTIHVPCSWLDELEGRCRFYEFRPDVCREFEVGGKWCSQFRELHQIG